MKVHQINDKQVTVVLPYSDQIVGNPLTGVIQGGALTTLLDTALGISIVVAMGEIMISPTLDLRIDYMTTAKPRLPVYARAEMYRITKHIIFCRGIAYQQDESMPVAHCVATFMRLTDDILENTTAVISLEQ